MPDWWGTRKRVSRRLEVEVKAMRASFGDTFRLNVPRDGLLHWRGEVELNMRGIRPRHHMLRIEYPANYPEKPPEAYVERPRIVSHKHQFNDGQLCLFNPRDGKNYGWNPARSTAVTVAGWAVQWLYAYYTWKATGDWPGEEENITKGGSS